MWEDDIHDEFTPTRGLNWSKRNDIDIYRHAAAEKFNLSMVRCD